MKTSIATVSISGDLQQKLGAIAKAGFDGVEIFENDFLTFDESPVRWARWRATWGWRSRFSSLSAILKACPNLYAAALSTAPNASST